MYVAISQKKFTYIIFAKKNDKKQNERKSWELTVCHVGMSPRWSKQTMGISWWKNRKEQYWTVLLYVPFFPHIKFVIRHSRRQPDFHSTRWRWVLQVTPSVVARTDHPRVARLDSPWMARRCLKKPLVHPLQVSMFHVLLRHQTQVSWIPARVMLTRATRPDVSTPTLVQGLSTGASGILTVSMPPTVGTSRK